MDYYSWNVLSTRLMLTAQNATSPFHKKTYLEYTLLVLSSLLKILGGDAIKTSQKQKKQLISVA
jgi:hypothetical protein